MTPADQDQAESSDIEVGFLRDLNSGLVIRAVRLSIANSEFDGREAGRVSLCGCPGVGPRVWVGVGVWLFFENSTGCF